MELTHQESVLLQQFVCQMDKTSAQTDANNKDDQSLVMVYKDFISRRDCTGMVDTLTTLATYYIENEILLRLIIPDKSVSDKTVEKLFFNAIDEVDEEKRKKFLTLLSIHRYMLFELIANKASILEQLSDYIDELMIEPGTA